MLLTCDVKFMSASRYATSMSTFFIAKKKTHTEYAPGN